MAELGTASVTSSDVVEFELAMHNSADENDTATRTISLSNPVTTAGGLSAIADFRNLLTSTDSVQAGLVPATFFQPTEWTPGAATYYITDRVAARIVQTTKTVTPIE